MNLRQRDVYEEALERLCEHLEVLLCATRAGTKLEGVTTINDARYFSVLPVVGP